MAKIKSSTWLSIGQAAQYLGISRDTLRRWEKNGKLKAARSPTNRRFYTKKQLRRLMQGKSETKKPAKKAPQIIKPSKKARLFHLNRAQQLVLIGVISFLVAFGLVFFLGNLLLTP